MNAVPDLHALARTLGGDVCGQQVVAPGPGHSPHDRSLAILVDPGAPEGFVVYSHAGDDALACRDYVRETAGLPGRQARQFTWPKRSARHLGARVAIAPEPDPGALALWQGAQVEGDLIRRYLRGRGIVACPPSLRQAYVPRFGRTPMVAMIAAVQASDVGVIAVQATFLTWQGKKAPVSKPKVATGRLGAGAVRLGKAGELLGIAEGIETALSAQQMSGVSCWASLGGQRLSKLWIPPTVRELHIFGDNDAAGHLAAEKAAGHFSLQGLSVCLRWPPEGFKDFNDLLQARSKAVEP